MVGYKLLKSNFICITIKISYLILHAHTVYYDLFSSLSFSLFMLISNERRFPNSGTDFNNQSHSCSFLLCKYEVLIVLRR